MTTKYTKESIDRIETIEVFERKLKIEYTRMSLNGKLIKLDTYKFSNKSNLLEAVKKYKINGFKNK